MSASAWFATVIAIGCLGILAWGRFSTHLVLLVGLACLVVVGTVPVSVSLSGFANQGIATIAALFVVAAGIRHTGALDAIGPRLLGNKPSHRVALARLSAPLASASAIFNNTPLVALLIPIVQDWCRKHNVAPSRLLIPLSYIAILGGTCTLIGTSTNLVIDGLMAADGGERFSIFAPALIGIPITITGAVVLLALGSWLPPSRTPAMNDIHDKREFTVDLVVPTGSEVVGKTVAEAGLRHLPDVYLVSIAHAHSDQQLARPNDALSTGDRLIFAGSRTGVAELAAHKGLALSTDESFRQQGNSHGRVLVEAVVATTSRLVGRSVNGAAFRTHYNAAVVAIARHGQRVESGLGALVLQAGDILLLETTPAFREQYHHSPDFYMIGGIDHASLREHRRAPVAVGILLAMIALVASGLVPLFSAAVAAAAAMVISGCCSMNQARRAIDERLLLTIACAFGIGAALAHTGAASVAAEQLLAFSGGSPIITLILVYIAAALATELVTNTAAAVMMWPIALTAASDLQVSMLPFAMAIMIACSASFITPLGYQTNLMVAGPGGYRFSDFMKIGFPVAISVGTVALTLIPQFSRFKSRLP